MSFLLFATLLFQLFLLISAYSVNSRLEAHWLNSLTLEAYHFFSFDQESFISFLSTAHNQKQEYENILTFTRKKYPLLEPYLNFTLSSRLFAPLVSSSLITCNNNSLIAAKCNDDWNCYSSISDISNLKCTDIAGRFNNIEFVDFIKQNSHLKLHLLNNLNSEFNDALNPSKFALSGYGVELVYLVLDDLKFKDFINDKEFNKLIENKDEKIDENVNELLSDPEIHTLNSTENETAINGIFSILKDSDNFLNDLTTISHNYPIVLPHLIKCSKRKKIRKYERDVLFLNNIPLDMNQINLFHYLNSIKILEVWNKDIGRIIKEFRGMKLISPRFDIPVEKCITISDVERDKRFKHFSRDISRIFYPFNGPLIPIRFNMATLVYVFDISDNQKYKEILDSLVFLVQNTIPLRISILPFATNDFDLINLVSISEISSPKKIIEILKDLKSNKGKEEINEKIKKPNSIYSSVANAFEKDLEFFQSRFESLDLKTNFYELILNSDKKFYFNYPLFFKSINYLEFSNLKHVLWIKEKSLPGKIMIFANSKISFKFELKKEFNLILDEFLDYKLAINSFAINGRIFELEDSELTREIFDLALEIYLYETRENNFGDEKWCTKSGEKWCIKNECVDCGCDYRDEESVITSTIPANDSTIPANDSTLNNCKSNSLIAVALGTLQNQFKLLPTTDERNKEIKFDLFVNQKCLFCFKWISTPLSKSTLSLSKIFKELTTSDEIGVSFGFNANNLQKFESNRIYRFVFTSKPQFDLENKLIIDYAKFEKVPMETLFTLNYDVIHEWIVVPEKGEDDFDNIKLSLLRRNVYSIYKLSNILTQGQAIDETNMDYPKGLEIQMGINKIKNIQASNGESVNTSNIDTIVMYNLGYFQLKTNPGSWFISLCNGKSSDFFSITFPTNILVNKFHGSSVLLKLKRNKGKEYLDFNKEPSNVSIWKFLANKIPFLKNENKSKAEINIFSVASGHLYERMLRIMIKSVVSNTKSSVKFWFIESFLSPTFKKTIPFLAKEYNFIYEMVAYKWPTWLRDQKEKQRKIWGYKILFLDVLFPLDLDKIIFVDADQVNFSFYLYLDYLHGAPYAFTPFCDSREDMQNFRFWNHGYWKSFLGDNLKYHISALFVVDLKRFREIAAGDLLRQTYHSLSLDPNSLANLDQDLPNHMQQFGLKIHSLPQEWLWCETWCDDKSLSTAKTIDLCNNPKTKEPKLDRARRLIPEWNIYDNELTNLLLFIQKALEIYPQNYLLENWNYIRQNKFHLELYPAVYNFKPHLSHFLRWTRD
ncbi:hypothetical protein ROZALSC1DRAFT_29159 [Rozella allomycis CSF55]|uniref:Uncharacterized protein n=1 Tax=Rozella allomycis (strain CSF55) TaxID=988480 RepID=A0A4P9YJE5_ROZAC|nr:hypothetical protein ROZALSC1DRAFT_29159 [Rozella allomycis CSF55]